MRGLVLEGGGAKGAFHIGVLKALYEHDYTFDGVTGTSIGAVNGAMIAQGDFDVAYEMWQQLTPSQVMDVDETMLAQLIARKFDRASLAYALKMARNILANKGLSMQKAIALLDRYIDEDKLRRSPCDFGLVTVDTTEKWKPVEIFKEDIPVGLLKSYIAASAYFPAFRRDPIDGKSFIDGGIYDNLPINLLIRRGGYDHIVAIRTMSRMPHGKVIDKTVRVDYINPSESLGKTLDFSNARCNFNLKLGYFDGRRYVNGYAGKRFYVNLQGGDAEMRFFFKLPEGCYRNLKNLFGVEGDRNAVIEKIFEVIRRETGAPKSTSRFDLFLAEIEPYAAAMGVEKFKIYSPSDFIEAIVSRYAQTGKIQLDKRFFREGIRDQAVYAFLDGFQN